MPKIPSAELTLSGDTEFSKRYNHWFADVVDEAEKGRLVGYATKVHTSGM